MLTSQAERCVQIKNACCLHIMVSKDKQWRRRSVISDLHIQLQCSLVPRAPPRFVLHPTAVRQIWRMPGDKANYSVHCNSTEWPRKVHWTQYSAHYFYTAISFPYTLYWYIVCMPFAYYKLGSIRVSTINYMYPVNITNFLNRSTYVNRVRTTLWIVLPKICSALWHSLAHQSVDTRLASVHAE